MAGLIQARTSNLVAPRYDNTISQGFDNLSKVLGGIDDKRRQEERQRAGDIYRERKDAENKRRYENEVRRQEERQSVADARYEQEQIAKNTKWQMEVERAQKLYDDQHQTQVLTRKQLNGAMYKAEVERQADQAMFSGQYKAPVKWAEDTWKEIGDNSQEAISKFANEFDSAVTAREDFKNKHFITDKNGKLRRMNKTEFNSLAKKDKRKFGDQVSDGVTRKLTNLGKWLGSTTVLNPIAMWDSTDDEWKARGKLIPEKDRTKENTGYASYEDYMKAVNKYVKSDEQLVDALTKKYGVEKKGVISHDKKVLMSNDEFLNALKTHDSNGLSDEVLSVLNKRAYEENKAQRKAVSSSILEKNKTSSKYKHDEDMVRLKAKLDVKTPADNKNWDRALEMVRLSEDHDSMSTFEIMQETEKIYNRLRNTK